MDQSPALYANAFARKAWGSSSGGEAEAARMVPELECEMHQWASLGSMTSSRGPGGEASSAPLVAVNATLLDPFTATWSVHYDAMPLDAYAPFTAAELQAAAAAVCGGASALSARGAEGTAKGGAPPSGGSAACPGILCTASMARLAAAVAGFQAVVATQLPVSFHVWLGDALELCVSGGLSRLSFDFIDTSNVVDHVGLLGLLAGGVPKRLARQPLARLRTDTMIWTAFADGLEEYVDK